MPITTVLLDVDGTLLDTRDFIYSAFEHTCAQHGLPVQTRTEMQPRMGLPLEEIYAGMCGGDAPHLVEAHRAFQHENLHLSVAFPGAGEALDALKQAGIALAAVTSRSRRTSVLTLERAGLAAYFAAIVSAEDAPALKPDPAPLRHALALLGRTAPGAVMVGDTAHDIEAGRALGLVTIGATYGFHGEAVRDATPDHAIASITELPGVVLSFQF